MTEEIRLKKTASRNDRRAALLLQGLLCLVLVVSSPALFSFVQPFTCEKLALVTLSTNYPCIASPDHLAGRSFFSNVNATAQGLSTGDVLKIIAIAVSVFLFILGSILIPLTVWMIRRRKKFYSVVWKKSSKFEPTEILGPERGTHSGGFRTFYRCRTEDELLQKGFEAAVSSGTSKRHLLVIGPPLAGKSRMVYEWISHVKPPADILIPHYSAVELESFFIPRRLKPTFRRPKVLLLDDLQRYVEFLHFAYLLSQFPSRKDITIIATCRSGGDYKKVTTKLLADQNIDLENLFSIIEIKAITEELARTVAEKVEIPWEEVEFNKTIGSVFLKLKEMRRRFEEACTAEERAVLRAMKRLYLGGLVVGRLSFPQHWVKLISQKKFELDKKAFEWEPLFSRLEALEFLRVIEEQLSIEEVYLEEIIEPGFRISLADFEELKTIFQEESDALLLLGNQLWRIGVVILEKEKFMTIAQEVFEHTQQLCKKQEGRSRRYTQAVASVALVSTELAEIRDTVANCKRAIKACVEASTILTIDKAPTIYATIQLNLGRAYQILAEVEEPNVNCRLAIAAYQEALQLSSKEDLPIQYALIQNNLGNVYLILSEVENKKANCKEAITAFELALQVRTQERFPIDYAMTMNNLGNAYRRLAEVENTAENCQKAIETYKEALKFYTLKDFPRQYASVQNNLGITYRTLAEVRDKEENCQSAIKVYKEALQVYTFQDFPIQYAGTQNNLGITYRTLAGVRDKEENCRKAIKACKEALQVYTFQDFPIQYAGTQNNLGLAYHTLAGVRDKEENCRRAIKAYKEALKVRTLLDFPLDYAGTQNNLGNAYRKLAEVEDWVANCQRAIAAFHEALRVRTFERSPMDYAMTQNNLGTAYATLAEVENKAANCQRAIAAFEEALRVYTFESFPMQYATTQNNLGNAYRMLAEVEEKQKNCREAIEAFMRALQVYTEEQFPIQYSGIQGNLARALRFCLGEISDEKELAEKLKALLGEDVRVTIVDEKAAEGETEAGEKEAPQ